jgi:hypothetical protein
MPKPKAPRKTELLDMGSRALQEYREAERRREQWATEHALREQLERLVSRDRKENR